MDFQGLISFAERILSLPESHPGMEQELEQYSNLFDEWYRENEKSLSRGESSLQHRQLEELVEKHNAVVGKAVALKEQTRVEIRRLRRRGKGILAYTGVPPERISIMRPKKW